MLVLALPGVAAVQLEIFALHQLHPPLTVRLMRTAVGALTTTFSTVLLAEIYARRVRGMDLLEPPQQTRAPAAA